MKSKKSTFARQKRVLDRGFNPTREELDAAVKEYLEAGGTIKKVEMSEINYGNILTAGIDREFDER